MEFRLIARPSSKPPANPYAPPGKDEAMRGKTRARRSWWDVMLAFVLALMLVPAVIVNGILWYGHFADLGIYDPSGQPDPVWNARPFAVPMLVFAAAATRLALSGKRSVWLPARVGFVIVALAALLLAVASRLPPANF
jgi:hypothetical protein